MTLGDECSVTVPPFSHPGGGADRPEQDSALRRATLSPTFPERRSSGRPRRVKRCRSLPVEMAATPTFGVASMCVSAISSSLMRRAEISRGVSADRRFGARADQRCSTADDGGVRGACRNLHAVVHRFTRRLRASSLVWADLAGRRLNQQCGAPLESGGLTTSSEIDGRQPGLTRLSPKSLPAVG